MRLLSSEQSYRSIASGLDPRGCKDLALIPALVLVTGVFVFFGGEAQAQQPEPQQVATPYAIAVEQTTEAPLFETSRTEEPFVETSPVETPPADRSEPPAFEPQSVDRQDPGARLAAAETTLHIHDSSSDSTPPEKPGLGPEPDLTPPVVPTPEPELPVLESVPEPLSLKEDAMLSSLVEEVPVPEPAVLEAEAYLSSNPGDPVESVPETLANTVMEVSRSSVESSSLPLVVEDSGLLDPALASLLSEGEVNRAPAGERTEDPEPPSAGSTGPENPTDGAPQPASPIAPPLGGSSFSGSGGQAGLGGGGFAPLLLACVLVSGLVLLRRDGLLRWASCEPPKPSSALLTPLERPG